MIMPVFVILFLSRYQIMLGRNLSLIQPFGILMMVYGLMEVKRLMGKYRFDRKGVISGILIVMVICNVVTVVNSGRYDLTYTQAAAYIETQIPEGSTIYCTSFAPVIDEERYTVIGIGEDMTQLPDMLRSGEYYVDTQYATGYFTQRKDYLVMQGEYMYPDRKELHEKKTGGYTQLQEYTGISYGGEWKYRIGYLDLFRYSPDRYYIGPTIVIYGSGS